MRGQRKAVHITFSEETSLFIERKSKELGLNKGQVVDWLVQKHKLHGAELQKVILKEVVEHVFEEYINRGD